MVGSPGFEPGSREPKSPSLNQASTRPLGISETMPKFKRFAFASPEGTFQKNFAKFQKKSIMILSGFAAAFLHDQEAHDDGHRCDGDADKNAHHRETFAGGD